MSGACAAACAAMACAAANNAAAASHHDDDDYNYDWDGRSGLLSDGNVWWGFVGATILLFVILAVGFIKVVIA